MESINTLHKHADNTIIVFDWDDTLFPTTYLNIINYHIDENVKKLLAECELHVINILEYFVNSFYHIYIVSNAEKSWIFRSVEMYYNRLHSHELFKKINIISARDTYINIYTNDFYDSMYMWKYQAMYDIMLKNINAYNNIKQIISFGDSEYERKAILSLTTIFPDIYCKNIKFTSLPTCTQIINQSIYIKQIIDFILDHQGTIDLNIEKSIDEYFFDIITTIPSNNSLPILDSEPDIIIVDRHKDADIYYDNMNLFF
jgi:transcription termination factor NusB